MSEAFHIVTHGSTNLTRTTFSSEFQSGDRNDDDSDKLSDLLTDMDCLKQEIQERMQRNEAVKQAKALLREDAIRTDALNQKMSEMRRSISEAQSEPAEPAAWREDGELIYLQPQFNSEDAERTTSLLDHKTRSHPLDAYVPRKRVNREAYQSQVRAKYPDAVFAPTHISRDTLDDAKDMAYLDGSEAQLEDEDVNVQEALTLAAQGREAFLSATQLLSQAEEAWKFAEQAVVDVKQTLQLATEQFNYAQSKETQATLDLKSTQQELTIAYQFASAAAQKQHEASEFFRKTNHWTVNAAALSWVATVWVTWASFHAKIPLWTPSVATAVVMGLAIFMAKWSQREE